MEAAKREKRKEKKEKTEGTNPTHSISEYTGKYTSHLYGEVQITNQKEKFEIRLFPHPNISGMIEHWQYNTFLAKWSDPGWGESFMYFDLDDMGNVKQFRMSVRPDWIDTLEYTFVKNK